MKFKIVRCSAVWMLSIFVLVSTSRAELVFTPSWNVPTYDGVREHLLQWLETSHLDELAVKRLRNAWPKVESEPPNNRGLLDRLVETLATVDPRIERLAADCNQPYDGLSLPESAWLADAGLSPWLRQNLRLYYARWLDQHGLYDEVLSELEDIALADVEDPASLLFCRMVAYHQLVQPDNSRAALVQLLEQEDALPKRYQQLAQLVKHDLATLEDESLDHIARRMSDVRRRLDLGRAGDQVQMVEQGVIQSLDKLIKKAEQQQQQCECAAGGGQSSKPMQDSRPAGLKAPGRVDPRDIGSKSGWGELPPKEREQAMQQIGREFPAYYREMIEQYFRDLASEGASDGETQPTK